MNYYPNNFWYYTNTMPSYTMQEKDENVIIDVQLPGHEKDDLTITYSSEYQAILIAIKDKDTLRVQIDRVIDPEKVTAELELGILHLKAPIKNTDKIIKIE